MPIHGLTTGVEIQRRAIRIGWLKKGEQRDTGRVDKKGNRIMKPADLGYFRFTGVGPDADKIEAAFIEVYGAQPTIIPDVRIPVSIAGNFDIQEAAYLAAYGYLANGDKKLPMLLAKSDGRTVTMMRDPANAAKFIGGMSYESVTELDKDGKPQVVWNGKAYPWKAELRVDLVLWDLSRALYERRLAGHGVVTLVTHSLNDIPSLIREYAGILDVAVSAFLPGFSSDYERAKSYLPLERIPIRLSRQIQQITTPDYRDDAPRGSRLVGERSLLHWQISPEFAAARMAALDAGTSHMLAALSEGRGMTAAEVNADLFGDNTVPHRLQAGAPEPDEADAEYIDEVIEEELEPVDDEPDQPAAAPVRHEWPAKFLDYCTQHISRYAGNRFMAQNALRKLFPGGPATDKAGARAQFDALKEHADLKEHAENATTA